MIVPVSRKLPVLALDEQHRQRPDLQRHASVGRPARAWLLAQLLAQVGWRSSRAAGGEQGGRSAAVDADGTEHALAPPRRASPITWHGSRNGAKALAPATSSRVSPCTEFTPGETRKSIGSLPGSPTWNAGHLAGQGRVRGVLRAVHLDAQRQS